MNQMQQMFKEAFAKADSDVDSRFLGDQESQKESGKGRAASQGGTRVQGRELSRIALLILHVDSAATARKGVNGADGKTEQESRREGRESLAARLGCTAEDLEEIADSYGEDVWNQLVLEERVRRGIDSSYIKDATWDRLEGLVLRKLVDLVDMDKVHGVSDLLAIAKTANTAIRKEGRNGMGNQGNGNGGVNASSNVNLHFHPGDPAAGVLPSGDLGTIQLKLSHRVHKQIEGAAVLSEEVSAPSGEGSESGEADSLNGATRPGGRFLDSIEMLDLQAIQEVGKHSEDEEK